MSVFNFKDITEFIIDLHSQSITEIVNTREQAEAEVVPSSSLVEIEVGFKVALEVGVEV